MTPTQRLQEFLWAGGVLRKMALEQQWNALRGWSGPVSRWPSILGSLRGPYVKALLVLNRSPVCPTQEPKFTLKTHSFGFKNQNPLGYESVYYAERIWNLKAGLILKGQVWTGACWGGPVRRGQELKESKGRSEKDRETLWLWTRLLRGWLCGRLPPSSKRDWLLPSHCHDLPNSRGFLWVSVILIHSWMLPRAVCVVFPPVFVWCLRPETRPETSLPAGLYLPSPGSAFHPVTLSAPSKRTSAVKAWVQILVPSAVWITSEINIYGAPCTSPIKTRVS